MKKPGPECKDQDGKPAELPLRDIDRARAIAGGNPALAAHVFEMTMQDLPNQLDKILQVYAEKNWVELRHSAHRLQGSVTYCAVPALEHSLIALKAAAASGQPDDIDRHVQALVFEVQRLLAFSLSENPNRV